MTSLRSRTTLVLAFLLTITFACSSPIQSKPAGPLTTQVNEVFFSPNGGATEAIVREIGNAKQEIKVQAYSFTSAPIAKALVDAHKRGVQVTVVLDKSQRSEKYSSADFLNNAGIPTSIDDKHAIAHNKIMIIDGNTKQLTGFLSGGKSGGKRVPMWGELADIWQIFFGHPI